MRSLTGAARQSKGMAGGYTNEDQQAAMDEARRLKEREMRERMARDLMKHEQEMPRTFGGRTPATTQDPEEE